MTSDTARLRSPEAVTFDCWQTLLYEAHPETGAPGRAACFARHTGVAPERAAEALRAAWRAHQVAWHRREVRDARAMTAQTLEALEVTLDAARFDALVRETEDLALDREIVPLRGAREALAELAARGVRLGLVCDTGYTPGRVIRQVLDRLGLLAHLEVAVFSNEVGVPKPHPRMLGTALQALGVEPARAVHVGDLRRSDIAGARALGMGSIRIALRHDDVDMHAGARVGVVDCRTAGCEPFCERPEADAVARSYGDVLELLRGAS